MLTLYKKTSGVAIIDFRESRFENKEESQGSKGA